MTQDSAPSAAKGSSAASVTRKRHSGLIVLVEDDPVLRKIYSARLTELGFTVAAAKDGDTGMNLLYTNVPKILILNVILPDIDGVDLCRRARDIHGDQISVIFLSTLDDLEVVQLCLEAGGNDYLIKSEDPEKLVERVLYWARSGRLKRREKYRSNSLAAIRAAIQVREAEAQGDERGGLTSDNDPDVAEISRFIDQARGAAGQTFGRSVEEKLYLIGYVAGVVHYWGTLKPHMTARLGDYMKAVMLETQILSTYEIGLMLGAWEDLTTDPTFTEAVGKGTFEAVARASKGRYFTPVGLSKFAQNGSNHGAMGELHDKIFGSES